jgi:hypothetical protein
MCFVISNPWSVTFVPTKVYEDMFLNTVVPRYTSLIRSRSLDLYQTGRIRNEFFP